MGKTNPPQTTAPKIEPVVTAVVEVKEVVTEGAISEVDTDKVPEGEVAKVEEKKEEVKATETEEKPLIEATSETTAEVKPLIEATSETTAEVKPPVEAPKVEEVKVETTAVIAGKVSLTLTGANMFSGFKSVEDIVKELVRYPSMSAKVETAAMLNSILAAGKKYSSGFDFSKRVTLVKK